MENKRTDITIIRVISMFMIVICHTIKYYSFIPGSSHLSEFFNIGVFVFFAISGFLYGKKEIKSYKEWFVKRIQKIWIPIFVLLTVDLLLLTFVFNTQYDIKTIIAYYFNLQGLLFINWKFFSSIIIEITNLGPLWFTTIIMMCYMLIPLLQKLKKKMANRKNSTV